jgi:hypothetical protein
MSDIAPDIRDETLSVAAVPSVAILADPRASVFLLKETIATLLSTYGIRRAYVDLTTLPGLTAAGELVQAGIAYEHLDFGQPLPDPKVIAGTRNTNDPSGKQDMRFKPSRPRTMLDYPYLKLMSAGTHQIDLDALDKVNANIALIPTMTADAVIDFSADSVLGRALEVLERAGRDALLVMPPERGLRPIAPADPEGSVEEYERITVLIRGEADSPATQDAA